MQVFDMLQQLKKYSYESFTKNNNKKIVDVYENENENYTIGSISYILSDNKYEIYLYVIKDNEVISNLLYKIIDNELESKKYFEELKSIVQKDDLSLLLYKCQNK